MLLLGKMTNEKAIEIIRKRITIYEYRLSLNRRYDSCQAAHVNKAILRELRYILAKIEKEGE